MALAVVMQTKSRQSIDEHIIIMLTSQNQQMILFCGSYYSSFTCQLMLALLLVTLEIQMLVIATC